jgi:hypothetical protein
VQDHKYQSACFFYPTPLTRANFTRRVLLTEAISGEQTLINTSCVCNHKAQRSQERLYELIKPKRFTRRLFETRHRERKLSSLRERKSIEQICLSCHLPFKSQSFIGRRAYSLRKQNTEKRVAL